MKYRWCIDPNPFSEQLIVEGDCPDKAKHTPVPRGYTDRIEYKEKLAKTLGCVRCPICGLWAIWIPKVEARAINKKARAEERKIIKAVKKAYPSAEVKYKRECRRIAAEAKR